MFFVQANTFNMEEDPPPPGIVLCFDATQGSEDLQMRAIASFRPILPDEVGPILTAFVAAVMPEATVVCWFYTGWVNADGELLGMEDGTLYTVNPGLN